MTVRIAHLSDPHFGTVKPDVKEALRAGLKHIGPDAVIVTGDVTQRARFRQFREAKAFFKTLSEFPVVIIPGNHDIPLFNLFGRFLQPYFGFRHILKGNLKKRLAVNGVELFGLKSTRRFRHVQGQMDVQGLHKFLSKNREQCPIRIVGFHHPLDCPKRVDEKNLLRGAPEVMQALAHQKVDMVLGGHIHDPLVSLSSARYPDVLKPVVISVAGTCLSWRTRSDAPNSFHLIEIEPHDTHPQMTVVRYDFINRAAFEVVDRQCFVRDPDAGWSRV